MLLFYYYYFVVFFIYLFFLGQCIGFTNSTKCVAGGMCDTFLGECVCVNQNSNSTYPRCDCVMDACGECNGNNTCVGCNGIPYAVADECGVCQGDGSSCKGMLLFPPSPSYIFFPLPFISNMRVGAYDAAIVTPVV